MIDKEYWDGFYKFWDWFVQEWFNGRSNTLGSSEYDGCNYGAISGAYNSCTQGLNFDELPEPYLGRPDKGVKAVIINLNPGMLQSDKLDESLERQKLYTWKDTYCGNGPFVTRSLIRDFAEDYNMRYSKFLQKWSCLNSQYRQPDTDLCGVKWWQGNNPKRIGGKRIPWMRRIYQTNIEPEEVFALELCPYHSIGFGFNNRDSEAKTLVKFIAEQVIKPAATVVIENHLPFAVAVGKGIADILDEIVGEFAKEWSYKTPKNERKYRLYVVRTCDGQKAKIIVTWLKNNRGIPAPGKTFVCAERQIREDCGMSSGLCAGLS